MFEEYPPSGWFRDWFNRDYLLLYPHRDQTQARLQVDALMRHCNLKKEARILDAACGGGRHLNAFKKLGLKAWGFDLSPALLKEALKLKLSVARADMRLLPFGARCIDLVTCFFSSFGYFASREMDIKVLAGFSNVLKKGGYIFLDLLNKNSVKRGLVKRDSRKAGELHMIQERKIQGDCVVKRITIEKPDGTQTVYHEKIRLYTLSEILGAFGSEDFDLVCALGDEAGSDYNENTSERMGLLMRKHE